MKTNMMIKKISLSMSLICMLALCLTGCFGSESPASENPNQGAGAPAASGGLPAADLPIDIEYVDYEEDVAWKSDVFENELYSVEAPADWIQIDGADHGLLNGIFLIPPDTDLSNFRFEPHVALELYDSGQTATGKTPDYSRPAVQKDMFATLISSTFSKMGGLSDLKFSVWESAAGFVYIASFQRSNDQLTMYQTSYYVMNPDRQLIVNASSFGEDSQPAVNEVARHVINTWVHK